MCPLDVKFGDIIGILDTIRPKSMILTAILFLCQLEGQDGQIIFGIPHFCLSIPKLN